MSANAAGPLGLGAYWRAQDYFLGFSYALAAAFAAWALGRLIFFRQDRAAATGAAVGGVTLVGILMAGGCFLIGCCGSPMLAVYLSLFGAKALGLGKPLTALITLASVSCVYWCLSRRFSRGDACVDPCCSTAGTRSTLAAKDRSEAGTATQKH
jgi:predicted permease